MLQVLRTKLIIHDGWRSHPSHKKSTQEGRLSLFFRRRGRWPSRGQSSARGRPSRPARRVMDPRLATARSFSVAAATPSPVDAVGARWPRAIPGMPVRASPRIAARYVPPPSSGSERGYVEAASLRPSGPRWASSLLPRGRPAWERTGYRSSWGMGRVSPSGRTFDLLGHHFLPKYLYSGKATRTTFTSYDVTTE